MRSLHAWSSEPLLLVESICCQSYQEIWSHGERNYRNESLEKGNFGSYPASKDKSSRGRRSGTAASNGRYVLGSCISCVTSWDNFLIYCCSITFTSILLDFDLTNAVLRRDSFDEVERDYYEALYTQSRTEFGGYVESSTLLNNYAHIFELLIRLRQYVFFILNEPCFL